MNLSRLLKQQATYWEFLSDDGYGGSQYASPVLVYVRWEDKVEIIKGVAGKEEASEAVVFSSVPLTNDSFIALGDYVSSAVETSTTTSTVSTDSDAEFAPVSGAMRVLQSDTKPSINLKTTLYKSYLGQPMMGR